MLRFRTILYIFEVPYLERKQNGIRMKRRGRRRKRRRVGRKRKRRRVRDDN